MKEYVINNYIDAIKYVSAMQQEMCAQSAQATLDLEVFVDIFKKAKSLLDSNINIIEKYGQNELEQLSAPTLQQAERGNLHIYSADVQQLRLSLANLINDIQQRISRVEQSLTGNNRRNATNESMGDLTTYYIELYALVKVYLDKELSDKTSNYQHIGRNYLQTHKKYFDEQFFAVKQRVEKFLQSKPIDSQNKLMPITEEIAMPKDFLDKAELQLGVYTQQYVESEVSQFQQSLVLQEEKRYKQLVFQLASSNRKQNVFSVDCADTKNKNSLLIHQPSYSISESDEIPLVELIESTICKYLNLFPRITKRLCVIQQRPLSDVDAFVSNINDVVKEVVFKGDLDDKKVVADDPKSVLAPLLNECKSINKILGFSAGNLYKYNQNNYKSGVWKQMTLLVIRDYPLGFDEASVSMLKSILQEAEKFGIIAVMSVCDDIITGLEENGKADLYTSVFKYFDDKNVFDINGYTLTSRFTYETIDFTNATLRVDRFDKSKFFNNLKKFMVGSVNPAIPLDSLFENGLNNKSIEKSERRENFFRVLTFPIGKDGDKTYNIDLFQSGGSSPHIVIAGNSGSGKSVLLHNIIISSMCHYTPDELEIYLFDFKESPEGFLQYKDCFPHVKKIAFCRKEKDIYELLDMVKNVYTNRTNHIKNVIFNGEKKEFANINAYNIFARRNGLKQIPRILVVIDEYQTITDERCLEVLLEIAQKGREFGVVLIMASQSNNVPSFGAIIKQFSHRFEFPNEPVGALLGRIGSRARELIGPKGLCFYSSNGSVGDPVLLRCAFIDKEKDFDKYREYVCKKYANYPSSTYLVGEIKKLQRPVGYDAKTGKFLLLQDYSNQQRLDFGVTEAEIVEENKWLEIAKIKFENKDSLKNRGFFARLGLNSISLVDYNYEISRLAPYMLLCGDSQRIKSLEYSLIKSALLASEDVDLHHEYCVYYFDGDAQRLANVALDSLVNEKRVNFVPTDLESICKNIKALHDEYKRRKDSDLSRFEPILVIMSEFNQLYNRLEEVWDKLPTQKPSLGDDAQVKAMSSMFSEKYGAVSDSDLQQASKDNPKETVDYLALFNELISSKATAYDIFFCLQLSDTSCVEKVKRQLDKSKLKSLMYVHRKTNEKMLDDDKQSALEQILSFADVIDSRQKRLNKSVINPDYVYKIYGTEADEFIPFEYNED